jgi:hypothetical protein
MHDERRYAKRLSLALIVYSVTQTVSAVAYTGGFIKLEYCPQLRSCECMHLTDYWCYVRIRLGINPVEMGRIESNFRPGRIFRPAFCEF